MFGSQQVSTVQNDRADISTDSRKPADLNKNRPSEQSVVFLLRQCSQQLSKAQRICGARPPRRQDRLALLRAHPWLGDEWVVDAFDGCPVAAEGRKG